jgi:hypothetical protein
MYEESKISWVKFHSLYGFKKKLYRKLHFIFSGNMKDPSMLHYTWSKIVILNTQCTLQIYDIAWCHACHILTNVIYLEMDELYKYIRAILLDTVHFRDFSSIWKITNSFSASPYFKVIVLFKVYWEGKKIHSQIGRHYQV